jgi:hypothetical protein
MYRITYEQGNGYRCGCCRRSYEAYDDVKTEEDVSAWVLDYEASQVMPEYEDDDDRDLLSIEKEIGVNIMDQFKVSQESIDHEIANRKRAKEAKDTKEKEEREAALAGRDKEKLKELAKKYPEVLKGA